MTDKQPAEPTFPVQWGLDVGPGPDGKTWMYFDIASSHSRNIHLTPLQFIPSLAQAMLDLYNQAMNTEAPALVVPEMSDAVADMLRKGKKL